LAHSTHIVIQEDYPNFLNEFINYLKSIDGKSVLKDLKVDSTTEHLRASIDPLAPK